MPEQLDRRGYAIAQCRAEATTRERAACRELELLLKREFAPMAGNVYRDADWNKVLLVNPSQLEPLLWHCRAEADSNWAMLEIINADGVLFYVLDLELGVLITTDRARPLRIWLTKEMTP